jgi:hypothetical protein
LLYATMRSASMTCNKEWSVHEHTASTSSIYTETSRRTFP